MKDRQNGGPEKKDSEKNKSGIDTTPRGSVKIFLSDDTGGEGSIYFILDNSITSNYKNEHLPA